MFKKSDADFNWFAEQVKSENKIRHVLDVGVIEAKELAGKDIEGVKKLKALLRLTYTICAHLTTVWVFVSNRPANMPLSRYF